MTTPEDYGHRGHEHSDSLPFIIDNYIEGLRPSTDIPGNWGEIYEHPDLPGHLIRVERDYESREEASLAAECSRDNVRELRDTYGVPITEFQQDIGPDREEPGYFNVYTLVPRYESVVSFEHVAQHAADNPALVQELDVIGEKLLAHIEAVIENGGIINDERLSLRQFGFVPELGQVVMIDMDTRQPEVVARPEFRSEYGNDTLIHKLGEMGRSIMELQRASPDLELGSAARLREVLDSVPDRGVEAIQILKE